MALLTIAATAQSIALRTAPSATIKRKLVVNTREAKLMDDKTILDQIHDLVSEEKTLRNSGHGLSGDQRQRLQSLEEQLDQCWDLLRQRRAREESGENPDAARPRAVNEVEG